MLYFICESCSRSLPVPLARVISIFYLQHLASSELQSFFLSLPLSLPTSFSSPLFVVVVFTWTWAFFSFFLSRLSLPVVFFVFLLLSLRLVHQWNRSRPRASVSRDSAKGTVVNTATLTVLCHLQKSTSKSISVHSIQIDERFPHTGWIASLVLLSSSFFLASTRPTSPFAFYRFHFLSVHCSSLALISLECTLRRVNSTIPPVQMHLVTLICYCCCCCRFFPVKLLSHPSE